jgi:hypothetical protein
MRYQERIFLISLSFILIATEEITGVNIIAAMLPIDAVNSYVQISLHENKGRGK